MQFLRRFHPEPPPWLYVRLARGPRQRRLYRLLAGDLAAALPAGATLLDVGTGPGYLLASLAELRPDLGLFGLDLSSRMIRYARQGAGGLPGYHWLVGDALALPFRDRGFAGALATFSLHIWKSPAAGLRELGRILKPGGRAFIYELNRQASAANIRAFARQAELPFLLVRLAFRAVSWHHALEGPQFAAALQATGFRWALHPAHHFFWRGELSRP